MILPAGCPRSVGVIAGNHWTKDQSSRGFPLLGPWLPIIGADSSTFSYERCKYKKKTIFGD